MATLNWSAIISFQFLLNVFIGLGSLSLIRWEARLESSCFQALMLIQHARGAGPLVTTFRWLAHSKSLNLEYGYRKLILSESIYLYILFLLAVCCLMSIFRCMCMSPSPRSGV